MGKMIQKSLRWSISISLVSAALAAFLTLTSSSLLSGFSWVGGLIVLFMIVAIGVIFDMLGIAAAAGTEQPFHAMAAKKVPGAREAIGIIRRADQFSNFCNDVVGDISSMISGAAAFAVISSLIESFSSWQDERWLIELVMVSALSALTVGGKALGKSFAIHHANEIIFKVGKIFHFINRRFNLELFILKGKKNRKRKRGGISAPRTSEFSK
jgi:CBS domain containing-hemolysin-like protein